MSSTSGNPAKRTKTSSAKLDFALSKVFFEKQDGALCGQHCLNNAVQCHMFNAVDLATLAKELDEKERQTMAACGTDTPEYRDFINKPSNNFDDSGYFGVQVLSQALKNLGMDLVPFLSESDDRAIQAMKCPEQQRLVILNMEDHWFSMRRFANQWINLNSVLNAPQLLSDSYFTLLLKTFEKDGYTLFFVFGSLLENPEADKAFETLGQDDPLESAYSSQGFRLGTGENESKVSNAGQCEESSQSRSEATRLRREAFLQRLQGSQGKSEQPSTDKK